MEFKKWRFFRVLSLARRLKASKVEKRERWSKLFWYYSGLFDGAVLFERRS